MTSHSLHRPGKREEYLAQALRPLLAHITHLLRATGCLILLRDPKTDMYVLVASNHETSSGFGYVVRPNEDMVSRVAKSRQPLIVNQYSRWSGRSYVPPDDQPFTDALLCVPLVWQDEFLGGLVVRADSSERQFAHDDVTVLDAFTPAIAALLARCSALDFHPDVEARVRSKVDEEICELREVRQRMAAEADQLIGMLADTVAIQEEERSRIAHDLHDGSNQLIVGAIFEIQTAKMRIARGQIARAEESLENAKALLRRIEAENHRIINGLRPPMLNQHGLEATLRWYLDSFCQQHSLTGAMTVQGESQRFSSNVEVAVFRIVQEALNNSLKHARAANLHLRLDYQPDFLVLEVQDDGCGFDPNQPQDHLRFGLIGMRERALSIGALLEIHSAPGSGTNLVLHVPVVREPDDPLGRFEQRHSVHVAYTGGVKRNSG